MYLLFVITDGLVLSSNVNKPAWTGDMTATPDISPHVLML